MTWPSSNPVSREINDFWKESQSLWQQWQFQADVDTKVVTGQQDYFNGNFGTNYRNQGQLKFNKTLRVINMLGGCQIKNRLATQFNAADNDPDIGATADEYTTVNSYNMRLDGTYDKISQAFRGGCLITGLNLLSIWMDFREDPENGRICSDLMPFSSFIMDAYWSKQDLSDCNRILTRKFVSKRALLNLIPGIEKDIPLFGNGYAAKDGKFQYMAQNWYQYAQEMFSYDEYWTKEYRKKRKIIDKKTGDVADWNGDKDQFKLLKRNNPNIELITTSVPTVRRHVLVNDHLIFEEQSPWGLDRLPFVPFVGYHHPEVQDYAYRYFGVVRNGRDIQTEINKRHNRLFDVLDAQVQSGLMIKEDALVNPEDAYFSGPGKILFFKQASNLASDVAPIPPPPVAAGWQELLQSLDKDLMEVMATPEELFGQDVDGKDQSGLMMQLRMGAGLVASQPLFNSLNISQGIVGEIFNELSIKNFSEGKIKQILGKPATEFFFDYDASRYHVIVDEAALTSTQRQLQFMQALQLKQLGIPISNDYLLNLSTLQGKKEVIESIMKQEQAAQQQQQMAQQHALQHSEIEMRGKEAKAQNDFAAAGERRARAVSDIGLAKERTSQAIHDRAAASLDYAKAIKELGSMDEERIKGFAHFLLDIQLKQKQIQGAEEGDSELMAAATTAAIDETERDTKPQKISQPQQQQQPAA